MKFNNIIKVIKSLLLVLTMLCSLPISISAAQKEEITVTPMWDSIATMDIGITFVEGTGNASGTARKQADASHIVGTLGLYKWNGSRYEFITGVSGSKTVGTLSLSIDFPCETGVQYKAVLTVTAYTDGVGESETITFYRTCK